MNISMNFIKAGLELILLKSLRVVDKYYMRSAESLRSV